MEMKNFMKSIIAYEIILVSLTVALGGIIGSGLYSGMKEQSMREADPKYQLEQKVERENIQRKEEERKAAQEKADLETKLARDNRFKLTVTKPEVYTNANGTVDSVCPVEDLLYNGRGYRWTVFYTGENNRVIERRVGVEEIYRDLDSNQLPFIEERSTDKKNETYNILHLRKIDRINGGSFTTSHRHGYVHKHRYQIQTIDLGEAEK